MFTLWMVVSFVCGIVAGIVGLWILVRLDPEGFGF